MEINWDFIVSGAILIWLGLVIAARITKQSIPELLEGIKDFIAGTREEALERGEELLLYNE